MTNAQAALRARYVQFWIAATVSALGDGVRVAVLPLLAASSTRDPVAIAIVTAAGFLPWPVLGLLGGAVSDRFDRRRLMWIVNATRALIVAAASVNLLSERTLPIAALAILAFTLGTAETVYDNAAVGFLPQLLPTELLPIGNSRLFTSQLSATQLVGPPLGGLLFALGAGIPLALDSISFALSALLIAFMPRTPPGVPHVRKNLRRDIAEGLTWLWRNPTLQAMAFITTALGAISGALLAMLVIYARQQLHLTSFGYGLLLGAFAIGSVSGALAAPRVMRRWPLPQVLAGTVLVATVIFACLAATSNSIVAALLLAALGVAVSTWNIASVTTRQRIVPNRLLGRVSSAYRASALTFTTLGALGAGVLTATTSVAATFWACSALALVGLGMGARGLVKIHDDN
ncbi:MFS transporter [Cryobacterium sp. TMT1-66-1]|uniref:MFS transporter n=1 Tax=Cryobacterium sp. TMT1-66-1 TaxID=1259242 RepID=UPI00106CD06B|nr:MFS transporter [Cryobacterium sp. TMT1-66-1]TFD03661.1 MFS transporter [Cryobacterium sp. TMT1-66-1]